jgi:hypothetical protein
VRDLRPGRRGLVVLDGAQRAYDPQLAAAGSVVARVATEPGFLRPDGRLDRGAALLVRGIVVPRSVRESAGPGDVAR